MLDVDLRLSTVGSKAKGGETRTVRPRTRKLREGAAEHIVEPTANLSCRVSWKRIV